MTEHNNFSIKNFGICDYQKIWNEMQQFNVTGYTDGSLKSKGYI